MREQDWTRLPPLAEREPALNVTFCAGVAACVDEAAAAAPAGHRFLRAAWYRAAAGAGASTLVARRPDGRTFAALPTEARNRFVREVPGAYWPFRGVPVAPDASEAELEHLLRHPRARAALGPAWRMGPVREDDTSTSRLAAAARVAGWTVLRRPVGRTWLLDVEALRAEGAWPRGSTLRRNRYFEKHLSAHGPLDFRFVTGSGWTAQLFDTLAAIEANSWVAKSTDGRDAKFLAPHNRRFWEAAAADPVLAGMMSAGILSIGGVPAAFAFDIDCAPTRYCIANSYDERFARHSPGRVLAYRNFQHLAEREITLLDWGIGDPGYKAVMGAAPGPEMVDWLFVRSPALAAVARRFWHT